MPYYYTLRDLDKADRSRAIEGIQRLRELRDTHIPARTLNETLLLATWNVRDLGNEDKRATPEGLDMPGPRLDESYFYIAEVISFFDIVALQEVNSLDSLKRLMKILGPSWDFLTTDIKPDRSGNHERMTFVYDKRRIWFKNMAGQIVLSEGDQFVRTPYYASFQCGWFQFVLCNVHIKYGNHQNTSEREREIDHIADFLADRVERTYENMVLLGDFNILGRDHATFEPLGTHGWVVPRVFPTNVTQSRPYDQIAFKIRDGQLRQGPSNPNAGTLPFFDAVFRPDEWETYYNAARATGRRMESWENTLDWPREDRVLTPEEYYSKQWRTWQMSDHMPLWVELSIDFSDEYLNKMKND
ncbi:MAG: endonuclease/exonuclease/phosphatase family protein [Pseudomonadota bacterium]